MYSAGGRGINGGGVGNALLCDEPSPAYLAASIFFSSAADIDVPALGGVGVGRDTGREWLPLASASCAAKCRARISFSDSPTVDDDDDEDPALKGGGEEEETKGGGDEEPNCGGDEEPAKGGGEDEPRRPTNGGGSSLATGTLLSLSSISRLNLAFSAAALSKELPFDTTEGGPDTVLSLSAISLLSLAFSAAALS